MTNPNRATPDNSHSYTEKNEVHAEPTTQQELPKLPLAFTVITCIKPNCLTKLHEGGKALEALLWATPGTGWCDIGAAGQSLSRCLVDVYVWQPERLDYAGPSLLEDGASIVLISWIVWKNAPSKSVLQPDFRL